MAKKRKGPAHTGDHEWKEDEDGVRVDSSGIGDWVEFPGDGSRPFVIAELPEPSDERRWRVARPPASELTALLYDDPAHIADGATPMLSDIEKAWGCAVEHLESHAAALAQVYSADTSRKYTERLCPHCGGSQPHCHLHCQCPEPRCSLARWIVHETQQALRMAREGDLGRAGAQLIGIGAQWIFLSHLERYNVYVQRGLGSGRGSSKGGKQKAENERDKAEIRGGDKTPQKARPGEMKMCDEPGCDEVFTARRSTSRFCKSKNHQRHHPEYDKLQKRLAKQT